LRSETQNAKLFRLSHPHITDEAPLQEFCQFRAELQELHGHLRSGESLIDETDLLFLLGKHSELRVMAVRIFQTVIAYCQDHSLNESDIENIMAVTHFSAMTVVLEELASIIDLHFDTLTPELN
jgi:hypothetical protein